MQSFPHSLSDSSIVETDIPARLDRLPWGRFHTRVVVALGITWILDGLEVTLAGALSGALKESPVLEFTNADVGIASSAYLAGAVLGAVFFGWLTDRLGRKRLFFITLAVYLVATAATAISWLDRPRHQRQLLGRRGDWCRGLDRAMRFWIPESPRWLVIHGRPAEAQLIIAGIEERFRRRGVMLGEESLPRIRLATRRFTPLGEVAKTLFVEQRRRSAVGLALM